MKWLSGYYDKREAMDGWVLYLSLMSLAAWRRSREGKEKRDTERREKLSCSPSCRHLTQNVAAGCVKITGSMTPREGQVKIIYTCGHWISPSAIKTWRYKTEGNSAAAWHQQRSGVGYLVETVRFRGAHRLIGQLQQLLWTLQGLGAGAQLTLRKVQNQQSNMSHVCPL